VPATRVVIFEKKRLLEGRLSNLAEELPIDGKPVRTVEEFQVAVNETPFSIALIEHDENLDETLVLLDSGRAASALCVIVLRKTVVEETRLLFRAAGAVLVLQEIPVPSRWAVLMANLVKESQDQLRASGGD